MRNLRVYPPTTDEIVEYLNRLIEEQVFRGLAPGDMGPTLLQEAVRRLEDPDV